MSSSGSPPSFIIASVPKAGTTYLAKLINNCGVICEHEYIKPWRQQSWYRDEGPWGDVSWETAPVLGILPYQPYIARVIRNPLEQINSLLNTGTFRAWGDRLYPRMVQKNDNRLHQACWYWLHWYRLIQPYAQLTMHVDRPESLVVNLTFMFKKLGLPTDKVEEAVNTTSRRINKSDDQSRNVKWKDLPAEILMKANAMQYDTED